MVKDFQTQISEKKKLFRITCVGLDSEPSLVCSPKVICNLIILRERLVRHIMLYYIM